MKILVLSDIQDHGKKCAEGLLRLGYEIIYAYPHNAISECVELDERIKLVELPYSGKKGYFLNCFALRKLYRKCKPDVVHVHYASGFGLLSFLAGLHPVALSCYGSDIFEFPHINKINSFLLRCILNYSDRLQSTSIAMANEIRTLSKNGTKRIDIIPFGINVDLFSPSECKPEKDLFTVGFIKSLNRIYDVPLLLHSFALVLSKLNNKVILKIYGDGPLRSEMEELSRNLGIGNSVYFMGRIANEKVPNILNEMDVFINSSLQESFGVNILEAMACEIPVIATDCVGPREIIQDGISGIILQDRKPETMANAIISLLNDKELRRRIGKAGRKRVLEKYNWEYNLKELEASLESIINK